MKTKFFIPVVVEIRGEVEIAADTYEEAVNILEGASLDDPEEVASSLEEVQHILYPNITCLPGHSALNRVGY